MDTRVRRIQLMNRVTANAAIHLGRTIVLISVTIAKGYKGAWNGR